MDWLWDIGERWLHFGRVDLTRYVIFAVGVWLVLWVALRVPMQGRKIRDASPPARQMVLEFLFSLRSIALFSTVGFCLFMAEQVGYLPGPALAATWGWPWFAISLVLMIVVHDTYFYWTHRLIHHPRLFRRVHLRHHRSNNPSPFTAYSFDFSEALVNVSFVPIWMVLVPTDWPVTGFFMLHQIARNTLQHSGYEIMPARRDGRPMFDWLTSVTHHDLHHAEAGWNYGLWFTWWDRLMGTEHPDYHARFAAAVRKRLDAPPAGASIAKIASLLLLGAALTGGIPRAAEAQTRPDIAGRWATQGFGSIVEFSPCAGAEATMCGRILWLWTPTDSAGRPRTDSHNPDRALRSRGLVGVQIVHGLRQTAPGVWSDGALYNPDDGRTYAGSISLKEGSLELKGCAIGVFCQTQTWWRAADVVGAAAGVAQ